ncbi:MAG TPA: hypothetical protein VLT33_08265 [Labilithrix sp.]|nr:hypothetical protein [Labilithrix sp.]
MLPFRPAVALVLAFTFVAGCGFLKKKKPVDDDESTTNAPVVQVGGTGAKNEKDVLRYANETPAFDEAAVIGKDGVKAKTFPATGADVASLPRGTVVVKKAKFFSTGILVLFDDPATANGTKLMGWIAPEALIAGPATTATATVAPIFTAPKIAVDAGPKDAGLSAVDAGKAVVDAGGVVAPTALLQVNPTAGKCPAGFALVGPFCRRPCNADRDCPANSFCTLSIGSRKTCASTR